MPNNDLSIVQYYGGRDAYECGYCKGDNCVSHGMWTHRLTAQDYQDLVDRGWRRCGHYCYKPNMKETCCPSYTIKCDATNFKLNKSHKKILKRMKKFLRDGVHDKSDKTDGNLENKTESENCSDMNELNNFIKTKSENIKLTDLDSKKLNFEMKKIKPNERKIKPVLAAAPSTSGAGDCSIIEKLSKSCEIASDSLSSTNPPRKKAKLLRLERKKEKLASKGIEMSIKVSQNHEKSLSDFINEEPIDGVHKLKVKVVPSHLGADQISYNLYKKYQMSVHHDLESEISLKRYSKFLVESSLKIEHDDSSPESGYGSFHQQYWLDDKLIAVGVIDILPKCISSVYFFYDPDYGFLSLGTYGSLREIYYIQQLANNTPALYNYYMGFYIHSCSKMRYKARLNPSYLLCPETYTWHIICDEILKRLDVSQYQRLSSDVNAKDVDEFVLNDIWAIPVLWNRRLITFEEFVRTKGANQLEFVQEYGELVGNTAAASMVLALKSS